MIQWMEYRVYPLDLNPDQVCPHVPKAGFNRL